MAKINTNWAGAAAMLAAIKSNPNSAIASLVRLAMEQANGNN